MPRPVLTSTLFPYTTLFRSEVGDREPPLGVDEPGARAGDVAESRVAPQGPRTADADAAGPLAAGEVAEQPHGERAAQGDRKSTRLNSSHTVISYAVFCLKKK